MAVVQGVALSDQELAGKARPPWFPASFRSMTVSRFSPGSSTCSACSKISGVVPSFGMAQDPEAVVEVAVQFHVPDGDQAVEPCVGHRLHVCSKPS